MDNNHAMLLGIILPSVLGFVTVYVMVPPMSRWLTRKKLQVRDVHVSGNVMVARPGGPAIMAGITIGSLVLYFFLQQSWIIAVLGTTLAAFTVGLIDDMRVMGGWFKPLGLVLSAIPLLIFGTYGPDLIVPLFGGLHIPILYIGVVILSVVLMGNTVNSIDVFSGLASAFIAIASIALVIALVIVENYEVAAAAAILAGSSIAYYRFHKIPCRIFPGDSGALALGAMYGAIAVIGNVEIVAAIAVLPAVIESFLYLSGTKRIVEHRGLKKSSTSITDDFKMRATFEKGAIPSLVGIILSDGKPMTEAQLVRTILGLTIISSFLAVITVVMMQVKII